MTILEVLQYAQVNVGNASKMPELLHLAKEQLDNAVSLLEKGYDVEEDFEDLVDEYGGIERVPNIN